MVSFEAEKIRPDLIQLKAGNIRDLLFTDKTLVVCQRLWTCECLGSKDRTIASPHSGSQTRKTMVSKTTTKRRHLKT